MKRLSIISSIALMAVSCGDGTIKPVARHVAGIGEAGLFLMYVFLFDWCHSK